MKTLKTLALMLMTLVFCLCFCTTANAQYHSYRGSYGSGYGSYGGYRGYYSPGYTYTYPSYYGYGTSYYAPHYGYGYTPYYTSYAKRATVCPPPTPAPVVVQPESEADKVLKNLLIRKLIADITAPGTTPPLVVQPPESRSSASPGGLSEAELAKLRSILAAIPDKKPAEKPE